MFLRLDNKFSPCYTVSTVDKRSEEHGNGLQGSWKHQILLQGYRPRQGLEGPFIYANGRILYYDPKEGSYWDPKTDFYVSRYEMNHLNLERVRCSADNGLTINTHSAIMYL